MNFILSLSLSRKIPNYSGGLVYPRVTFGIFKKCALYGRVLLMFWKHIHALCYFKL